MINVLLVVSYLVLLIIVLFPFQYRMIEEGFRVTAFRKKQLDSIALTTIRYSGVARVYKAWCGNALNSTIFPKLMKFFYPIVLGPYE